MMFGATARGDEALQAAILPVLPEVPLLCGVNWLELRIKLLGGADVCYAHFCPKGLNYVRPIVEPSDHVPDERSR